MGNKVKYNPAQDIEAGETHRDEEHLGGRKVSLDEAVRMASRRYPGRKPAFEVPLQRLNAFIPTALLLKIKTAAAAKGMTIGEFVAEWAKTL
jgi:hypothetical protein